MSLSQFYLFIIRGPARPLCARAAQLLDCGLSPSLFFSFTVSYFFLRSVLPSLSLPCLSNSVAATLRLRCLMYLLYNYSRILALFFQGPSCNLLNVLPSFLGRELFMYQALCKLVKDRSYALLISAHFFKYFRCFLSFLLF